MEERSSAQGGGGGFGGTAKWIFGGIAVLGLAFFLWPSLFGKGGAPERQPLTNADWGTVAEERGTEETCELVGQRSTFVISSRGGAVTSAQMHDPKYAKSVTEPGSRIDLVTTTKEQRMPLRTLLRAPGDGDQAVELDTLDFVLQEASGTSCTFLFETANTKVEKVVSLTERPFELATTVTVTNVGSEAHKHRYAVEQTTWRSKGETESSFWDLGRRPEWQTEVITHTDKKTVRETPAAFEPGDFDPDDGFTAEHFMRMPGNGIWVGVSSNYFTSTVAHVASSAGRPWAEVLVEDGDYYKIPQNDPAYGHLYRARLSYAEVELAAGDSASYENFAFFGPKERDALAAAGGVPPGGGSYKLTELIDLGMFGLLGGLFVQYVGILFKLVGSWGWAICLLTITVKLLVFPLTLPNMKMQVAMRKLKPQVDEINAKYKDDMMQKTVAMQELHRQAGIRPMLGCLPMLLQMPVWIALYQALGTAVELYHTPFLLPLIPDLTHADPYHVIPIVLGGSSFLQQKLMPAQGMDPAQQKMMTYLMPAIFTVMMFFLPAGLGVYMLTNTWLGIVQQFLVEKWIGSRAGGPPGGRATIQVREIKKRPGGDAPALGKGNVRAGG